MMSERGPLSKFGPIGSSKRTEQRLFKPRGPKGSVTLTETSADKLQGLTRTRR